MEGLMDANPALTAVQALLSSVPSVGPHVARTLIAELPELGQLNGKQIAALAGLAPFACDSGTFSGRRRIFGGRPIVRQGLYQSAVVAARWNPQIAPMYERLKAAGKPSRVALVACARKLLVILNAMMRDAKPWQPLSGQ